MEEFLQPFFQNPYASIVHGLPEGAIKKLIVIFEGGKNNGAIKSLFNPQLVFQDINAEPSFGPGIPTSWIQRKKLHSHYFRNDACTALRSLFTEDL